MNGGRWSEAKKIQLELKRAKKKEKKEKLRERIELRQNFGFKDDQEETTCQYCSTTTGDVYRFKVELPRLRSRIAGYPVLEICPACFDDLSNEGARLISVPELTAADLSPRRNIYDPLKGRKKIF